MHVPLGVACQPSIVYPGLLAFLELHVRIISCYSLLSHVHKSWWLFFFFHIRWSANEQNLSVWWAQWEEWVWELFSWPCPPDAARQHPVPPEEINPLWGHDALLAGLQNTIYWSNKQEQRTDITATQQGMPILMRWWRLGETNAGGEFVDSRVMKTISCDDIVYSVVYDVDLWPVWRELHCRWSVRLPWNWMKAKVFILTSLHPKQRRVVKLVM